MAIQIPSAAGFIPQESVIDGITKFMNYFSADAKRKRQADMAATEAGTAQTAETTRHIPKYFGLGERDRAVSERNARVAERGAGVNEAGVPIAKQNADTMRINADTNKLGVVNQDTQFKSELPIKQQQANTGTTSAATQAQSVFNQNRQYDDTMNRFQLPKLNFDISMGNAGNEDARRRTDIYGRSVDQQGDTAKQTLPVLMKAIEWGTQQGIDMTSVMEDLIKNAAPGSVPGFQEGYKRKMDERNILQQRGAGQPGQGWFSDQSTPNAGSADEVRLKHPDAWNKAVERVEKEAGYEWYSSAQSNPMNTPEGKAKAYKYLNEILGTSVPATGPMVTPAQDVTGGNDDALFLQDYGDPELDAMMEKLRGAVTSKKAKPKKKGGK